MLGLVKERREMGSVVDEVIYPAPLALHGDVINNPTLFMETLSHFHTTLRTRFTIPVIGGKELDLHLLYGEVTRRGGFEKKWKDVIAAFKFPPTTTSASFVLRKYYISLLYHYEQVCFLRLQGKQAPPPESLNFPAVGIIDGKFDNGYFMTVTLGSKILQGVLYHVPPLGFASMSSTNPDNAVDPFSAPCLRCRWKRGKRRRSPAHPKTNQSAYNFFFAEKHSKLKLLYPQRERKFSKMIGESRNKLTQEERTIYQDYGLKDRERYKREMQEYRERLKQVQPKEAGRAGPSSHTQLHKR